MVDFCLVLVLYVNICVDWEWKEDDWIGVICIVWYLVKVCVFIYVRLFVV